MSSISSEQAQDSCHSLPLLVSPSAIIKDIHQEISVLFLTPPTMTVHKTSIKNLLGPTPGQLVHDPFLTASIPTPPALASNHQSFENVFVTGFDTETSGEWSETTPPMPLSEVQSPNSTNSTTNIGGETVVCNPLDVRDHPFVIPANIPWHQYTQVLPPCQLC
jgi:hypothetical protein